jgi:L-ascorbate metabolism protein UlaG (beta-lactamase superfamily)
MTDVQITFIGNATTVLELGGFTLLTDPAFGHRGSRVYLGYGAWTKRRTDPALEKVRDPSGLDAILLSHLHGDHFDKEARKALPAALPVVTTPQASRRLTHRTTVGLPTWETHEWSRNGQRLRVTAVPGQHGPGFVDRLLPDVMGSLIELEAGGRTVVRLYITGDTLYRPFLDDAARRMGEIDAMLIHLGGTRLLGMLLTMDDRHGVAMAELFKPRITLPIHYDDYTVMKSPLSDFLDACRRRQVPQVWTMDRGESVTIPPRA